MPNIKTNSGFSVNINTGSSRYCSPQTDHGPWTAVELGYPSAEEPMFSKYAEDQEHLCGTVYGWVPVGLVMAVLIKHGGINLNCSLPKFNINEEQSIICAEALFEFNIT